MLDASDAGKILERTEVFPLMTQRYWKVVPGSARMVLAMSGGVDFFIAEETLVSLAGSGWKDRANELQDPDAAWAAEAKVAVAVAFILAMEQFSRGKIAI